MFKCNKCGACCRSVGQSVLGEELALGSGICKYLDQNTNLCTIYDNRPILCNIDKYYHEYLMDSITIEDFYEQNHQACNKLRKNLNKQKGR